MHVYHEGYNKEGCGSDEGWCFKDTVGNALPYTFFSYAVQNSGGTMPTPAMLSAVLNMHVPDQTAILNRAAQDSVLEVFAPDVPTEVPLDPSKHFPRSWSTTNKQRRHRFIAIYLRRQASLSPRVTQRSVLSASQEAVIKGYSNGFLTAKIFAANGLSKLGFEAQYVEDSLRSLGEVVDRDVYREWHRKGLVDGETMIRSIALAR